MYKHILLPTDGSELSGRAVESGIALAKALGAKVTAFFAKPSVSLGEYLELSQKAATATTQIEEREAQLDRAASRILHDVEQRARDAGVECAALRAESDHPARAIIEAAHTSGCDLIFMASHGRRGIDGLLLGSETSKVLAHSKIPVLVCR